MANSNKPKVFISSKMIELRDVRDIVDKALHNKGIYAWVYELDAGARPEDILETSLREVEAADIFVGLFWEKYGEVTIREYRHARSLGKPCFIYIRDKNCQRENVLADFLRAEVCELQKGVTYDYFDSAVKLGEQAADDIMAWLVRQHREMTSEIQKARVSQNEIARLRADVERLQAASSVRLPQGTSLDDLARQMRSWFEALDYSFEDHEVWEERYFEWIIKVSAWRRYDLILIRGIEGEAGVSDIHSLRESVDKYKADKGCLVAARRVSQAAHNEVNKKEYQDLSCCTFDELLDQDADFSNYFSWLENEIKRRGIEKGYVPLACVKEEFDPNTKKKIAENSYDEKNGWIDGWIIQVNNTSQF